MSSVPSWEEDSGRVTRGGRERSGEQADSIRNSVSLNEVDDEQSRSKEINCSETFPPRGSTSVTKLFCD